MRYAPNEEKHPEQRIFTMWLYIISALGAISQYGESWQMVILGCFVVGIAGFMVKAQRLTAKGTIYESHVEWTSRTLTIGSRYLFPAAILVTVYLVDKLTDIDALMKVIRNTNTDDLGVLSDIVHKYIADNLDKIDRITFWCITPPIFWWVRRCWTGLVKADKSEPIDYPDSII